MLNATSSSWKPLGHLDFQIFTDRCSGPLIHGHHGHLMRTPEHKRWDCEEDRQANEPMDKAIVGVGREEHRMHFHRWLKLAQI